MEILVSSLKFPSDLICRDLLFSFKLSSQADEKFTPFFRL